LILNVAVYVDNLTDWGWRHGLSCHMIADSIAELMEFARTIGLRPEWFQPKSSPHFDLTVDGRKAAVLNGATELGRREFVKKLRELRAEQKEMATVAGIGNVK
jgi:hypothetical protein